MITNIRDMEFHRGYQDALSYNEMKATSFSYVRGYQYGLELLYESGIELERRGLML